MRLSGTKAVSIINTTITLALLTAFTVLTHTEFILPPFIATAATKHRDPEWRFGRSVSVMASYVVAATVAVLFTALGLTTLIMAIIASILVLTIEVTMSIEHPPSLIATFLGVITRQGPTYILHPVLIGIAMEETVNAVVTRILAPRLSIIKREVPD